MIVPPLGLGLEEPVPSLLLALACLVGLVVTGRAAGHGRGRRWFVAPMMFCLLALALILAAREIWSLSW